MSSQKLLHLLLKRRPGVQFGRSRRRVVARANRQTRMPEIEQHAPREGLKVALREKGFRQCQRMETLEQRTRQQVQRADGRGR